MRSWSKQKIVVIMGDIENSSPGRHYSLIVIIIICLLMSYCFDFCLPYFLFYIITWIISLTLTITHASNRKPDRQQLLKQVSSLFVCRSYLFFEWLKTFPFPPRMSVVLDDKTEFMSNPYYDQHEPSNYQTFYVTLGLCTVFAFALLVVNLFLCCFSKHRHYWRNSETGE